MTTVYGRPEARTLHASEGESEGARGVRAVVSLRVAVKVTVRVRVWIRFTEGFRVVSLRARMSLV